MQLHNLYYFISQSCQITQLQQFFTQNKKFTHKNSHKYWAIFGWFAQLNCPICFLLSSNRPQSLAPLSPKNTSDEEGKIYKLSFSLRSFKLILHGSKIQSSSGCLQSLHLRWVAAQKWPIYSALCSRKKTSLMLCCVFDDNNPNNLTANGLCKKKNAFYFLKFSPASLNHRRSADSSATDARMSIATRSAAFSNLAMPRMSTKNFSGLRPISFFHFFRPVKHIPSLSRGRSSSSRAAHRKVDILFSFQFERLPSREMCELRSRLVHIREKKLWFVVRLLCATWKVSVSCPDSPSPPVCTCVCMCPPMSLHISRIKNIILAKKKKTKDDTFLMYNFKSLSFFPSSLSRSLSSYSTCTNQPTTAILPEMHLMFTGFGCDDSSPFLILTPSSHLYLSILVLIVC